MMLRFPLLVIGFSAALILSVRSDAHSKFSTSDGLESEDPVPEVIVPDDHAFTKVHRDNDLDFDEDLSSDKQSQASAALQKKRMDQFLAPSCDAIQKKLDRLTKASISRTTQYFIPMFAPGENGGLQKKDRRACINVEGSCVVEKFLYNWDEDEGPWGKKFVRNDVPFRFGMGSGKSYYNTTNALDPCRTLAADKDHYEAGTVVFIPSMKGKVCPQNHKPIDGCFVISDVGSAIQGQGRFDIFAGECANYNKDKGTCDDADIADFSAQAGDSFYIVGRYNILAKTLREEADLLINNDWKTGF